MHTTNNGVKIQTQTASTSSLPFPKATLIKLVFTAVVVAEEQNGALVAWGWGEEVYGPGKRTGG